MPELILNFKFDCIYISHIHPDHCSDDTLQKISKEIPIYIHSYHLQDEKKITSNYSINHIVKRLKFFRRFQDLRRKLKKINTTRYRLSISRPAYDSFQTVKLKIQDKYGVLNEYESEFEYLN